MPFRPCPSGCGHFLFADDGHDRCLQCLGFQHAEDAFVDDSCACCGHMSMISLRSRLSFMKGLAPSAATRAGLSASRGSPADALGDLRVTVRASPPGTSPRTSYSSRSEHPVRFPGDFAGPSHRAPSISFGAPSVDRMSIAASGDGFTSSEDEGAVGLPPSGVVATAAPDPELTAMLARAAVSIGLEINRPHRPEPSRLDDWFLGAGRGCVPFFPEVHEELTKSWMSPFTARICSSASSMLTTLDGGVAILQVHQAKALKQVHEGSTDPGLMQELRTATDFALRATKVTARSLGKAMSTMVVQERHLWLNLAEMKDADKARFLDAPISQAGLFSDTVEGFAQQFSAVQQQTEAIQHILPRRDAPSTAAPGTRPQSARRCGCPPASSRAAPPRTESTPRPATFMGFAFKTKGLLMGHLNIRSVASKTEQLEQLLTNSNIDLLCLSETWLAESSPNIAYLVPGYKVFRKDCKFGNVGGLLMYVKDCIKCKEIEFNTLVDIEYIAITIVLSPCMTFTVVGIYRPPSSSSIFYDHLINLLKGFDRNKEFILVGDFNINWNEKSNRKKLQEIVCHFDLIQLIQGPTRTTSSSETQINLIFSNKPERITKSIHLLTGLSDHNLLLVVRKLTKRRFLYQQDKNNLLNIIPKRLKNEFEEEQK